MKSLDGSDNDQVYPVEQWYELVKGYPVEVLFPLLIRNAYFSQYIAPIGTMQPQKGSVGFLARCLMYSRIYVGGVPSVLVNRSTVTAGSLASIVILLRPIRETDPSFKVKDGITACKTRKHCTRSELYQDITGSDNR